MSIFEIIMLVCFGASWPISIHKSYRSKSNSGKSLGFLCTIELGYVAGMLNKLIYNRDPVLYLYVLNAILVFIDITLYFRNKRYKGEC
jgi:uncharacterized membrane protein YbjE (DUF340 family)